MTKPLYYVLGRSAKSAESEFFRIGKEDRRAVA